MITFIELFAGIGGFRLGLEKTGQFKCIYSNDIESKCKITYDNNFDNPKLDVKDIYNINMSDLPFVELIVGGFPCQSFSIAGLRKGFEDERGTVFFRMVEIIKYIKPKYIFLENVKNLLTHNEGNTFNIIKTTLKDIGYYLKYEVLNTMTHTIIPQNRERLFIVGCLNTNLDFIQNFKFPSKMTSQLRPVLSFLQPDPLSKYIYTEKSKIYPILKDNVTDPKGVYQFRRHYVRKNAKNVCPTLTANMGSGGHNVPIILDITENKNINHCPSIRKLTPKETLLLQGFPEDYILPTNISDSTIYKQIGNSVTVELIYKIGQNIINAQS